MNQSLIALLTLPGSDWEMQFKAAIKAGNKPENDLFEGLCNEFDKSEW
jgi:hypothetical protein